MDLRDRLHAAAALTVVPSLVLAPVAGAVMVVVMAAMARPVRPAGSRDAALVLGAVVALLAIVHADAWWSAVGVIGLVWLGLWCIVRLDASANRVAARRFGLGAVGTAVALAALALVEARATAFAQVAAATHHPNATAVMALGLMAGSMLAWGDDRWRRAASLLGVAAALVVLALTGSRGGLVALAASGAVLLLVLVGRGLVRAGRRRAGAGLVVVGASVLLVAAQAAFMGAGQIAGWRAATGLAAGAVVDGGPWAAFPVPERLMELAQPLGASGGRLAAWKLAREMIGERPVLGYGFDAIDAVFAPGSVREVEDVLAHPHHGYLALVLQGGSLLLISVLALLGGLCVRLVRPAVGGEAASAALVAVMVGLFVAEMLDSVVRFGSVGGIVLVALVMAAATAPERVPAAPTPR